MITNKIGLEAEFFLRNKDGKIIFPSDFGFITDEFCLLGEFRGDPGSTREEAIANFLKAYYAVVYKARAASLSLELNGWLKIEPSLYAEALRKMGAKSVARCANIYGTDILSMSDAEIVDGKIIHQRVSAGLHVHFSSEERADATVTIPALESMRIPIGVAGSETSIILYKQTGETKKPIVATASRITKPVIHSFVKSMDESVLGKYIDDMPPLKYRVPGFYETKAYGFEYRSLPFSGRVLADIDQVADKAFSLLESL